jgi:cytochrome c oxidase assembly protein subunit 15
LRQERIKGEDARFTLFYTGGSTIALDCEVFRLVTTAAISNTDSIPDPIPARTPSRSLRRFAWGVLGFFILTILWGAVVRATGSGAGCGEHWPLCNGTILQPSPTIHTIIELSHRISAGAIDSVLIIALVVWTWRQTVAGHLARWAVGLSIFLTVTEGALGAVLVKFGLTAESRSPMRAPVEALHLTNTLLLLAALAMTAHLLGRRIGYRWRDIRISAPVGTTVGMIAILIVGVTGSLAALGDTLFPATSLGDSLRDDFTGHLAGESTWLLRWRWTHPTVAILASIFLIWLLIRAARRSGPWDNRPLSILVVGLLAAQYVLGALDVWLLAPVWMQVVHLLGADLLWTALVVLTARLTILPVPGLPVPGLPVPGQKL